MSGIHWHGIELANEIDGTPFTQDQVPPGGSFLYKFKVTRPGLFWYHPHHHSSTDQVFKGLYGMIIVKDPNGDALRASGTLPAKANTRALVLSDTTVCKTPGTNDAADLQPDRSRMVGGGALPAQLPPTPKNLCEGPGVAGPARQPLSDRRGRRRCAAAFAAGDIPNIQTALHAGRINEGQTVLTNGKNVGAPGRNPVGAGRARLGRLDPRRAPGSGSAAASSSTPRRSATSDCA